MNEMEKAYLECKALCELLKISQEEFDYAIKELTRAGIGGREAARGLKNKLRKHGTVRGLKCNSENTR